MQLLHQCGGKTGLGGVAIKVDPVAGNASQFVGENPCRPGDQGGGRGGLGVGAYCKSVARHKHKRDFGVAVPILLPTGHQVKRRIKRHLLHSLSCSRCQRLVSAPRVYDVTDIGIRA